MDTRNGNDLVAFFQVIDELLFAAWLLFGLRTNHEQPHHQDHTSKEKQGTHSNPP